MFKTILSLLIINIAFLNGDITTHLKKANNKGDGHSMRNIDFIYMINLDQRPEKWKLSQDQLNPYGIYPYRFSAVNGWGLSLETINDIGVKYSPGMKNGAIATSFHLNGNYQRSHEIIQNEGQTYFAHGMARGTLGIALSHISILYDAYNSEYETIWVMEDDIEVVRDPHLISDLIDKLDRQVGKENWDILYTDQDSKNQEGQYVICLSYAPRPNYTPSNDEVFANRQLIYNTFNNEKFPTFHSVGARYGTYSMIIQRSGMKKILDFFQNYQLFLPIDMEIPQVPDIRLFTVHDDIVSTFTKASSDNGLPNYLNSEISH